MNDVSVQIPAQRFDPTADRPVADKLRAGASTALDGAVSALRATGRVCRPYVPSVEGVRKVMLNVLIVIGVLLGVAVVTKASLRNYVTIDPINVPKALADRGLTGEVIAQRIHDEITEIGRFSKMKSALGEFSTYSFERTLPKIDLPVGGISLGMIVGSLRDFLGLLDTKITGEVVIGDETPGPAGQMKTYSLRLRISDRGAVFRHDEPTDNIDTLVRTATMRIVERFDPHIAAAYHYARGDFHNASRMVHMALSDSSTGNDAMALNLRGLIAKQQQRYDDALAQFKDLRLRFPDFLEAQHHVASTLILKHRYAEALEEARRGIALDPKRVAGYSNAGSALYSMHRYNEALQFFEKSTEIDPSAAIGYLNQAAVYRHRPAPDQEKAIALYRRAADVDPRDQRIFVNWGSLMQERGDNREAQLLFERAIDARRNVARPHELLGLLLLDEQKWKKAGEHFGQAIKIEPKTASLHYGFGRAMRDGGKLEEAAQALREAIEINEAYPLAYATLAITLAETGRRLRDDAVDEDAAEKERIARKVGEMRDESNDLLEQAQGLAPHDGRVLREIGRTYEALERYDDAAETFRRAIAVDDVRNSGLRSDIDRLGRRIAAL
jgi:tetratricopeptide (TPR) repeat protein